METTNHTPLQNIRKTAEAGFTLIEMMIVIAILGLLAGLIGVNVAKRLDESKVTTAKLQIRQLGNALDDFRRVCGFYPMTEQGLDALLHAPQGRECKGYDPEGFLKAKSVPTDPWKNQYLYESDGVKYLIKSMGADAQIGGEGINKDLSSDDQD